jgi:nucleoside-diphosphate-sugar epimerase
MRVLLESPERWTKVYCLSRRPPPPEMLDLLPAEHRSRVVHVACDFLSKPGEIAKAIKDKIKSVDVVFFYSYLQPKPKPGAGAWSNAQELVDVNSALFDNFLNALPLADLKPKRVLLQTGAKNYGVHLGRARAPYIESDPRVTLEPNFYYPQEDLLWKYCKANNASWNIICPAWIIGAVTGAAMNALHPLAVYAAVQAHKGEPLHYPGDIEGWNGWQEHSTAMLTGYLSEWAVLEESTKDQKFNASDNCPVPINRLWPELASWFGVKEVGRPEADESKYTVVDPGDVPTPLGWVSPLLQ